MRLTATGLAVWGVALAASAACASAGLAAGPSAGVEVGVELAARLIAWISGHVQAILATAYDRAPVLVVVMAALLIIPMTALVALLAHSMRLRIVRSRRPSPVADRLASLHTAPLSVATPEAALWPQAAWLDIEGGKAGQTRLLLPRVQGLVRIGRHEDNDIRLPYSTVHRHHALIHRTPAAEFVITDLSGRDGNGVVINGEKRAEARLAPGDMIVLGDARLRFDSAPL